MGPASSGAPSMARHVMWGDQPFSAHQFTHCSSTASGASRHRRASTSLLAMRRVSTEENGQWDTFARAPLERPPRCPLWTKSGSACIRTKAEAVLLSQPHGFKRLLAVVIHVHSANLAGDQFVDVSGGVFKRNSASGDHLELAKDQYALAVDGVDALHLDAECRRRFLDTRKELADALWASGRSFQGGSRLPELDLGSA